MMNSLPCRFYNSLELSSYEIKLLLNLKIILNLSSCRASRFFCLFVFICLVGWLFLFSFLFLWVVVVVVVMFYYSFCADSFHVDQW